MKYLQALTFGLSLFQATSALPTENSPERRQAACTSPRLRKSWNAATAAERKAYIDAAVCLTKTPGKLGHASATLHDDFTWVHNKLDLQIHRVAAFLPWHRLFMQTYENALKTECGYTGTVLYWDFVADAGAPASSTVWDPTTGFGGNGVNPDGTAFNYCVQDGPFKDLRPLYWGNETRPHCLQRAFSSGFPGAGLAEMQGYAYNQNVINGIFLYQEFLGFHQQLEGAPHTAVHGGIAGNLGVGDMGPATSPNDPIFYLVHTKVDQIWWTWQQENAARLTDYSGNVWPEDIREGMGATLDDALQLLGLGADKTVRDLMDTNVASLCYTY